MSLLYAVGFLAAAALVARPYYVANRLPRIPRWAGSAMTTCSVMLATGFVALGVGFALEFALSLEELAVAGMDVVLALGLVAVAALLWVLIGSAVGRLHEGQVVEMPITPNTPAAAPAAPKKAA